MVHTDRQTDTQTDIATLRLIWPSAVGRFSEKLIKKRFFLSFFRGKEILLVFINLFKEGVGLVFNIHIEQHSR